MPDVWFFDVLPCRPAPYEDECLSGYLLRLAAANGTVNFGTFIRTLFPMWPAGRGVNTLCWEYPVPDWDELPRRTQLPRERLDRMTLLPWVAKFRELPLEAGGPPCRPGQMLRGIVRPTLQVCPLCLEEKPYRRLLWRLQSVTTCVSHGCYLQDTCHVCGELLPVVSNNQQHLHCSHCGNDLRRLPILPASAELLAEQARQQPDWEFLLNPAVSLINESEAAANCRLPRMIGLKLRYLRYQTGLTTAELGQQIQPSASQMKNAEHGWQKRPVPLTLYLSYLKGLGFSWRSFAALSLPPDFIATQLRPPFMSLRICPTAGCPSHQLPAGTGVGLRRRLYERKLVVLKCKICKRKFTRTYDGELVTKFRHPPLPPETKVNVHKPKEQIEEVRRLGLEGTSIRQITKRMGWGKETVRNCWHSLGITEEVHTAQKLRRQQKSQKLREALWSDVEKVLDSLCQQETSVRLIDVAHALGQHESFIYRYPDIASRIREVVRQHEARVKQRRFEELEARIRKVIAEGLENDTVMSTHYILERIGIGAWQLQNHYHELWQMIREAVATDKEQRKAQRIFQQCQEVNEVATQLIIQGIPLTKTAIIEEVRKRLPITMANPQVNALLDRWVGDLGSGS